MQGRAGVWRRCWSLRGAALPAWIAAVIRAHRPQTRDIHIEAYRYGFSPSRIHSQSRGSPAAHLFDARYRPEFLLPGLRPSRLDHSRQQAGVGAAPVAPRRSARADGNGGNRGGTSRMAGMARLEIAVSQSYLQRPAARNRAGGTDRRAQFPAVWRAGAAGCDSAGGIDAGGRPKRQPADRRVNLFSAFPWLKRVLKAPSFQFNLALPMLGVFWFIILAGLFGTKVAGRNAGPMIIWVLWLSALIIVLVPIGGRIWCTVCPLPLIGEWLQRRRLSRNPAELEGNPLAGSSECR